MAAVRLVIGNRNYSSWSLRAWLVLRKAGIGFEEIRIPLFVAGYAQEIRKYSPAGKVPVYCEGSLTIWDSLAIAEYCAEHAPWLWPAAPALRAQARALAAEMHAGFGALRAALPMNCRALNRRAEITDAVAADIARVQSIVQGCRTDHADGGPWLFGAFSIADAMYAPVMSRLRTYGVATDAPVAAYVDTVLNDPEVQRWYAAARAETEIIEMAERPERD